MHCIFSVEDQLATVENFSLSQVINNWKPKKNLLQETKQNSTDKDHTSYLSLFLHNRNLRPGNFTLESVEICDKSSLATKQRKLTSAHSYLCVKLYTVFNIIHCV